MRFIRIGMVVLALVSLTGCEAWTRAYQRTVYGYEFEPGTPCKKGEVWQQMECRPKKGGAS